MNYKFTPADNGGVRWDLSAEQTQTVLQYFLTAISEGINSISQKTWSKLRLLCKIRCRICRFCNRKYSSWYILSNQGANVVFSVAGSVGDGAATKAKEEGKLAIQVDANKDDSSRDIF